MTLKKRLACLHAHHSNIEYIENALSMFDVELIHYVEPGLMQRVTNDNNYLESDAQNKVSEQVEWIAQTNVDAILITCTNYIALLKEESLSISIPIIKIDEPFFEAICNVEHPQIILFTNPTTVDGTVARLKQYALQHKRTIDFEIRVINNTFALIMQGKKEEYNQEVIKYISRIIKEDKREMSVAQLSMVEASQRVEIKTSKKIINPLSSVVSKIGNQLELEKKH